MSGASGCQEYTSLLLCTAPEQSEYPVNTAARMKYQKVVHGFLISCCLWAWGLESGPLWVSCSSCAQGAGRPAAVLGREPEMREQSCCLLGSMGQPSRLWGWVYPGVECCQLWLWAVRQRHCWGPQWQRLPGPHKPGHGTTVVPAVWLVLLDHLLL